MISTLIIEDEVASHEYLSAMLSRHFPEVKVLGVVESVPEAVDRVRELDPQLIFLDIELPPFTGFNFLEETRGMRYHTIFTTHFNKYAVHAFKFSAVHYLEKPFGLKDLKQAVNFYKERVSYSEHTGSLSPDEAGKKAEDVVLHNLREPYENHIIGFPVGRGAAEFCQVKNILRCEADSDCAHIHFVKEKEKFVTKPLLAVEKHIQNHLGKHSSFFRIHQSHLINVNHLVKFVSEGKDDGGFVQMLNGEKLPVSRRKKPGFNNYLKSRGLL